MDSDLAWVNGKSGRQSWHYAYAFQRSIISEAIHHLFFCISPAEAVTVNDQQSDPNQTTALYIWTTMNSVILKTKQEIF